MPTRIQIKTIKRQKRFSNSQCIYKKGKYLCRTLDSNNIYKLIYRYCNTQILYYTNVLKYIQGSMHRTKQLEDYIMPISAHDK